jgi:hypothetical protein
LAAAIRRLIQAEQRLPAMVDAVIAGKASAVTILRPLTTYIDAKLRRLSVARQVGLLDFYRDAVLADANDNKSNPWKAIEGSRDFLRKQACVVRAIITVPRATRIGPSTFSTSYPSIGLRLADRIGGRWRVRLPHSQPSAANFRLPAFSHSFISAAAGDQGGQIALGSPPPFRKNDRVSGRWPSSSRRCIAVSDPARPVANHG